MLGLLRRNDSGPRHTGELGYIHQPWRHAGLRQVRASDHLAGSRLSAHPQGTSRNVGRERNLLVALREMQRNELTFAAARFTPGAAFATDERQPARAIEFGVSVMF